jgi:hypothetical protein
VSRTKRLFRAYFRNDKTTTKRLIPLLIVAFCGVVANFVGLLFNVQKWPYGSEFLIIGALLGLIGGAMLIVSVIKIFRSKK